MSIAISYNLEALDAHDRILHGALISEDWAANTLSRIIVSTYWQFLCTELCKTLQICIEPEAESRKALKPALSAFSKPHIFFAAAIYAQKMSKAAFSGSSYDDACWNCRKSRCHAKCLKLINFIVRTARKAGYSQEKAWSKKQQQANSLQDGSQITKTHTDTRQWRWRS